MVVVTVQNSFAHCKFMHCTNMTVKAPQSKGGQFPPAIYQREVPWLVCHRESELVSLRSDVTGPNNWANLSQITEN